jgi:predicted CXXCH cytochrome family protein
MQTEIVKLGRSLRLGAWIAAWIAGVVLSAFFASAYAGVKGSKHDLGATGQAQQTTNVTTEVCSFCHTPHGSDISANAPLWNKKLQLPAGGYKRYSTLQTSTLDGGEAPVGSVSLACLSCHDGTQAMDVVINKPGQLGYNAAGAQIDLTSIGPIEGAPIPMLGTDLSNDHPISIQYAGGGCSTTNTACTNLKDKDFKTPVTALINSVQQWWVDTTPGTTGTRDKTDMILYTRSDGPLAAQEPFVECASCHDPHESEVRPVSFMRLSNANSDVCLACHTK